MPRARSDWPAVAEQTPSQRAEKIEGAKKPYADRLQKKPAGHGAGGTDVADDEHRRLCQQPPGCAVDHAGPGGQHHGRLCLSHAGDQPRHVRRCQQHPGHEHRERPSRHQHGPEALLRHQFSAISHRGVVRYPFEEPGSGPNPYRFDDNVVYVFYVATNQNHVLTGRSDLSYQFQFHTTFQNNQTIFQSFTGVVTNVGDVNQNMVQTYTVTKVVLSTGAATVLGSGIVPPNNEGISTPFYNQGNNGNNPAQSGAVT